MRRRAWLLWAVLMAALALSGCGGPGYDNDTLPGDWPAHGYQCAALGEAPAYG